MHTLLDRLFHPRTVGLLRLATGLLFMSRARAMGRTWVDSSRDETTVLVRSVGARDLAIGAGLLATGRPEWLVASVFADCVDGTDAIVGEVPPERRRSVASWAFGFAAYGGLTAVRWWRSAAVGTVDD